MFLSSDPANLLGAGVVGFPVVEVSPTDRDVLKQSIVVAPFLSGVGLRYWM